MSRGKQQQAPAWLAVKSHRTWHAILEAVGHQVQGNARPVAEADRASDFKRSVGGSRCLDNPNKEQTGAHVREIAAGRVGCRDFSWFRTA